MARQNRTKSAEAAEGIATEEIIVTENTETIEGVEVVETPVEAPVEAAAEVVVDLTDFKAAVAEALAAGNEATGELTDEGIAKVNEAYRGVEGNKGKAEARKFLEDGLLAGVQNMSIVEARGYSDLKSNLSAAGGSKVEKAPADPSAAFVQRVASLELALTIVKMGAPEGMEGVDEKIAALVADNMELVKSYVAFTANTDEDKGEAPELNAVTRAAIKAASGKSTGGSARGGASTGVRRDIAKHITSAFEGTEVGGFLSIAEIAKHKSAEYGDDAPSQGAISARLFNASGKVTVEGIEAVEAKSIDGKNPKGARKVA